MNSDRRKAIDEVIAKVQAARSSLEALGNDETIQSTINDAKEALEGNPIEDIKNDEQEAFDNLSDGLQGGEKGQVMEEAIGFLESADGEIQEAFEKLEELENIFAELDGKLEEAISALQSAKGE